MLMHGRFSWSRVCSANSLLSVEFFGQFTELVKLKANHLHLITMHRAKHLTITGHGLLKLIKHICCCIKPN